MFERKQENHVFIESNKVDIILNLYVMIDTAAYVRNCGHGFFGQKRRLTCPFPHFGLGCAQKCNCEKELCNHVDGCNLSKGKLADHNYIR